MRRLLFSAVRSRRTIGRAASRNTCRWAKGGSASCHGQTVEPYALLSGLQLASIVGQQVLLFAVDIKATDDKSINPGSQVAR